MFVLFYLCCRCSSGLIEIKAINERKMNASNFQRDASHTQVKKLCNRVAILPKHPGNYHYVRIHSRHFHIFRGDENVVKAKVHVM